MIWTDVIRMHWAHISWLRDQFAVDYVVAEIKIEMANPPNNDELCAAIRWLAGPIGHQEKVPGLRDVIKAVYILRGERRVKNAEEEKRSCGLCNGGWLYYPDGDSRSAIPCPCAHGNQVLRIVSDYKNLSGADLQSLNHRRQKASELVRDEISTLDNQP